MTLRDYQQAAVSAVRACWAHGSMSICLVAPTGAGKTRMGEELIADDKPALWVAHRRELVIQTALRLRTRFGARDVGVIMPGEYASPKARVQVGTVQTLIARESRPVAKTLVLDEAHHYVAEDWRQLLDAYPGVRCVGPTATPERGDGEPLGDIFDDIVVAASYSQLVATGHLVPVRLYQPREHLGNDVAQDHVEAWSKYSEGGQTFLFCPRVEIAKAVAGRFRDHGVPAGTIDANTPKAERDDLLARFRRGALRVLTNVNTLTEGIDVPEASVAMLARNFGHVGGYLQAAGRVLRPAEGKAHAVVIDLVGSSLRHKSPTTDRDYSLIGRAISGSEIERPAGDRDAFEQSVRGVELVPAGSQARQSVPSVPVDPVDWEARRREFSRLRRLAQERGLRTAVAESRYRTVFGESPLPEWMEES